MARLSRLPKTPKEQTITSDNEEEEEDVNEGAMEPSSDAVIGPAGNELTRLNFSDLPDTPQHPTSSPPQTRSATKMGNEQSREATNAALHQTTNTLLKDSKTRKKSNGKLASVPRTASTNTNPAYRNPVMNQKPLANGERANTFDFPGDDEEQAPVTKRKAKDAPPISPRKPNKKVKVAHTEAENLPLPEAQQSPKQRRSDRQRQQLEAAKDDLMNSNIRKGPFATEEREEVPAGEQQAAPFKGWNRRSQAAQDEDAAAGAEEDDGDMDDNIDVAQSAPADTSAKSASGNGVKGKKQEKAGKAKPAAKSKTPETKRARGRPSKKRAKSTIENVEDDDEPANDQADGLFLPDGEQDDNHDDDREGQLHVDKARKSELFPHPTTDNVDGSDGDDPTEAFNLKAKKKPKASTSSSQANTSKKLARRPESGQVTDPNVPTLNAEGQDTRSWLHGRYNLLNRILKNVDYVGCNTEGGLVQRRNKISLEDGEVKDAVMLCRKASKRFKKLSKRTGELEAQFDPAEVLTDISQRVDGLRGVNEDFEVDFDSQITCRDIYAHLIPRLVELLWDAAQCYVEMDKNDTPEGQIKIGHLQILLQIVKMILDLERAAEIKYTKHARPASEVAVVRPVHNGIAVPLRDVSSAFNRAVQSHLVAVREDERRQYDARYDAERLEREARAMRQEAKLREMQKKWEMLHDERQIAEGGIVRPDKRIHLQMPSHDIVEFDENGEAFTRAEGFLPRVGPNPSMIAGASSQVWNMDEIEALIDGLQVFTGPRVFENTFRKYCGRAKALNRFNVTEIVTTAAKFKELMTSTQMDERGEVDDWVTAIPVWTRGQAGMPGQENEDSVVEVTAEA